MSRQIPPYILFKEGEAVEGFFNLEEAKDAKVKFEISMPKSRFEIIEAEAQ